jgi:excisionase family DNA binding protein
MERLDEPPETRGQPTETLWDAKDVANYLRRTVDWVYAEVRADRIPHVRLGRYVVFRKSSIDAWLDALEAGRMRRAR